MLDRIIKTSTNPNDIVLDAFCGCGTALVAAENLGRQWIGIDISPTACRVMAKRLRDVCHLKEDEALWRAGRGFVVRGLPWSEAQLSKLPPFEFENWAVIALGGIPNKTQVGDMGIDGRIYPVSSMPRQAGEAVGELAFMDVWYPIQVKQKDKAGRPDIDSFEAVLIREKRTTGFFVSFDYTEDALEEIERLLQAQRHPDQGPDGQGYPGRADCEEVGVGLKVDPMPDALIGFAGRLQDVLLGERLWLDFCWFCFKKTGQTRNTGQDLQDLEALRVSYAQWYRQPVNLVSRSGWAIVKSVHEAPDPVYEESHLAFDKARSADKV